MNFHKTIGFLASLLLIVGIGVPDSFAQNVSTLSLTVSPRTLRDSSTVAGGVTVTARLSVTLASAATVTGGRGVDVAVVASPDATTGNLETDGISYEATVGTIPTITVAEGSTRATGTVEIVFAMSHDDDSFDEEVTVTATVAATEVAGDDPLERTAKITVTDHSASLARNAVSARGYQVHLTAPTGGNTARAIKDAVKVQVRRKRGLGANFGSFSSIEVALRNRNAKGDEDVPEGDLYTVSIANGTDDSGVTNFVSRLGTLALSRVRTATLTVTPGTHSDGSHLTPAVPHTINAGNTKAYYTRGSDYDILEFRFHPTGGGSYDKLYALVVFNEATEPTDGLNLSTENDLFLSSLDTGIAIYPPDPPSYGNQKVARADRSTGKLDAGSPIASTVTGIAIEIDGEAVTNDGTTDDANALITAGSVAGVGQKIKISVSISDFGEHSLVLQILGRDARTFRNAADDADVNVTGALQPLTGHVFKPIGAVEVIKKVSDGDPVVVEVPVTAGKFKRKANVAAHPTNKTIKKNGLYEDDEVVVRVRAQVKDRAGNAGNQTELSPAFVLDSRPPKVTINYPKPSSGADSTRFTAALTQDYTFLDGGGGSADLKPLNFKVDEATTEVYVVINEDTLTVDNDETAALAAQDYNLTAESVALKNTNKPKNNKHPEADSKQGGKAVKLKVVAKDRIGNVGVGTPAGGDAIFDAKAPVVTIVFPTNKALEGDAALGNKIGGDDRTQDPLFKVNEATDSILVRYVSSERTLDVAVAGGSSKVNQNISVQFMGDQELVADEAYDLQIYARDLAGQVGISDSDGDTDGAQPEEDLIYESGLMNPQANMFNIVTKVRTGANNAFAKEDSVVAGQSVQLTITAGDSNLNNRPAVAYRQSVMVVAMDSDGNKVSSTSFSGTGVKDNGDGTATLAGTSWSVGVFSNVLVKATMAGDLTIAVKDDLDNPTVTGMANIHVDAANLAGFNISIMENNQPVDDIRGAFQIKVVPADMFGNSSVKSYKGDALADTLDLLDSRMPDDTTLSYGDGINSTFSSWPVLAQLPPPIFPLPVPLNGRVFGISEAPAGETLWLNVAVVNGDLMDDDEQSKDVSSSMTFNILSPLMPMLTLWGPNGEDWTEESEIVIPADAADGLMVTVRADGYEAGSMVTFSDGTEATADDDGNAALAQTITEATTLTLSATDGRYMAPEKTWMFVETPSALMRMAFTTEPDGAGDPVYLIDLTDNTVGLNDYTLFRAAWDKTRDDNPDDQSVFQSDINDDGRVNLADYGLFVMSWDKTANPGPVSATTKPIVLLPGINENAEFSLNLGSERVVAGELVAVDVSLANVEALVAYGFTLNYDTDKFEFVSVAPAGEDLLKSTGGETPMFHHIVANGQVEVANGLVNGSAVSGGGDIVRFVFRVLYEFEDNARFEIADGLVFDPTNLSNPAVVAGVLELQSTPREFALHQNFPNPFNPDTTIKYDLAESSDVTLQIYNVLGQVVRTLVASEVQNAGRYQIRWNGMDDRGVPVSSGVYFYQISAEGKFQQVQKLMLLK